MFFYTFDPKTLNIIRCSNALIPPNSNTNVIFPNGLILNNEGKVVVSYGDGDAAAKLLLISTDRVNDFLIEDLQVEDYT